MSYKNKNTMKKKSKGGWQPTRNSRKTNKSKKRRNSKSTFKSTTSTSAQTGKQ